METRDKDNKWGQQTFRENSDHECLYHRYGLGGRKYNRHWQSLLQ